MDKELFQAMLGFALFFSLMAGIGMTAATINRRNRRRGISVATGGQMRVCQDRVSFPNCSNPSSQNDGDSRHSVDRYNESAWARQSLHISLESRNSIDHLEPTVNVDGSAMFGGVDIHGNAFGNTARQ